MSVFAAGTLYARGWDSYWSWTNNEPVVLYSNLIPDANAMAMCVSELRMMTIEGESEQRSVCLNDGDGMRFGMYYKDGAYTSVVGLTFDDKMYKLLGTSCSIYDRCLYVPGADVLITKRRLTSSTGEAVLLYKNFSKHIKRTIDPSSLATTYTFESTSKPDYLYTDDPMKTRAVGGYAASDNGKWLALEIREKGIYIVDTSNYAMRRISTMQFNYLWGMAPATEMAVSNDGHHVAVMGMNAGLTVYDIDNSCGDSATVEDLEGTVPLQSSCRQAIINTSKFIPNFFAAVHPRFSDNGAELSFYSMGYRGDQREVVLRAAEYDPPRLEYLALGDSYSSGEGETSDDFYLKGTNDKYEKCHTSIRSYPYLTAKALGIGDNYAKSVACSGATTKDVIGDDSDYWGQGARLGKQNAALSIEQKTLSQTVAREDFLPGRIHQAVFVEQYKPGILTVGIGGNDVGFMDKLKGCLGVGTCEWAATPEGREKTAMEIQSLFYKLIGLYGTLHRLSPQTTIYAVGYPKIIDQSDSCSGLTGIMFDSDERRFMNEGIKYINQVIAAAAKKSGVKYINIEDSLGDQVLCGPGSAAMNGVRVGDDVPVVGSYNWSKIIGSESFHPSPYGSFLIGGVVSRSIEDGRAVNPCELTAVQCIIGTTAPWPSNYWLVDGVTHDYASQRNIGFVSDTTGSDDARHRAISLSKFTLEPGSNVRVEVHSEAISLGNFSADSDGSLVAELTLPANLPDGYHTVHLYGTSFSGYKVDLYDVIPVTSNALETNTSNDVGVAIIPRASTPAASTDKYVAGNDTAMLKQRSDYGKTNSKQPTIIGSDNKVAALFAEPGVMGDSTEATATAGDQTINTSKVRPLYYIATVCLVVLASALLYIRKRSRL